MRQVKPQIVEIDVQEFEAIFQRAAVVLQPEEINRLRLLVQSHCHLLELIARKNGSLRRLRKLIFGASTEKTEAVLNSETESSSSTANAESSGGSPEQTEPKKKVKGHGRNGADAYVGAKRVRVPLTAQQAGDSCPECIEGTLYNVDPGVLIRLIGQAPVQAIVYELEKRRCNLCGKIFTAPAPEGIGAEKYDATVGSIITLLKYGGGFPFNRQQKVQAGCGIPLPASTQWGLVAAKAASLGPAHRELIRLAAQGELIHNDDTTNKILEFMGQRAKRAALEQEARGEPADDAMSNRTGLFTTGIVSCCASGQRIALFFTGRKHSGENLRDLLQQRAKDLSPPIQMCDALSWNIPGELQTILANCLAHGRRKFVEFVEHFPDECRYVLEALRQVYRTDEEARQRKLSPEARLELHQQQSGPVMQELRCWLDRQFDERLVEPNSEFGKAIAYMRRHWEKLTLFLRKAGAPLDNNLCERMLKKIILHRKNSLFFLTQRGAEVADLFTSLIATCELNGANAFDYLTELERHAEEVALAPQNWLPWNYRTTLGRACTPPPASAAVFLPSMSPEPALS